MVVSPPWRLLYRLPDWSRRSKVKVPSPSLLPPTKPLPSCPLAPWIALLKDIPQLTNILLYHVVPGKVMAADVVKLDGKMADTALEGKQIGIKVDGDKVMLNDNVLRSSSPMSRLLMA